MFPEDARIRQTGTEGVRMKSETIGSKSHRWVYAALLLFAVGFARQGHAGPFQGFWSGLDDGDYEVFLRVDGDGGYYCVMDNKSSFQFKVIGDSITTPMNGMDKIRVTTDSILTISGVEKGIAYASHFGRIAANKYPEACNVEERAWYGTADLARPVTDKVRSARSASTPFRILWNQGRSDLLGRDLRPVGLQDQP
jgi:hypothetical protein